MDGFGPAVDGYVDVADQLPRYISTRAAVHFEAERAEKRSTPALRSRSGATGYERCFGRVSAAFPTASPSRRSGRLNSSDGTATASSRSCSRADRISTSRRTATFRPATGRIRRCAFSVATTTPPRRRRRRCRPGRDARFGPEFRRDGHQPAAAVSATAHRGRYARGVRYAAGGGGARAVRRSSAAGVAVRPRSIASSLQSQDSL